MKSYGFLFSWDILNGAFPGMDTEAFGIGHSAI